MAPDRTVAVNVTNPRFLFKALNAMEPRVEAEVARAISAEWYRMTGLKPIRRPARKKVTRRRPARRARGGKS